MKDEKSAKFKMVYERLLNEIQNGKYLPGAQLPTEAELAETFMVSRNTLRQALTVLVQNGYISNQQGRGTFVLKNMPDNAYSFEQIPNPMIHCAKCKIDKIEKNFAIQNTNTEIRNAFGLDASKLIIRLQIKYFSQNRIVGFTEAYIPYDLLSEAKIALDNENSVFDFYNYMITRSDIKGDSNINIDKENAIEVSLQNPAFKISETYRDKSGRMVLIQSLYMGASDYQITIHKPTRI